MGYNPINGESYATKDGLNSKVENEKGSDETAKTPEEENGAQVEGDQPKEETNGDVQVPADTAENGNSETPVDKPINGHANGHSTAKVRGEDVVFERHCSMMIFTPFTRLKRQRMWTILCPENSFECRSFCLKTTSETLN